jgi:hypothetical protein
VFAEERMKVALLLVMAICLVGCSQSQGSDMAVPYTEYLFQVSGGNSDAEVPDSLLNGRLFDFKVNGDHPSLLPNQTYSTVPTDLHLGDGQLHLIPNGALGIGTGSLQIAGNQAKVIEILTDYDAQVPKNSLTLEFTFSSDAVSDALSVLRTLPFDDDGPDRFATQSQSITIHIDGVWNGVQLNQDFEAVLRVIRADRVAL